MPRAARRKTKVKEDVNVEDTWILVNGRKNDDYGERITLAEWLKKQKAKEIQYKLSKSDEEPDSEENIRRGRPVEPQGFFCYGHLNSEPESDEEVFGDSDCDDADFNFVVKKRVEIDRGHKFVVRKRWRTVTNPTLPKITYFKRKPKGKPKERRSAFTISVVHDPASPVAAISKLALKTYNTIQDTKYEYVGLVKAYQKTADGFYYCTRFKARLRGQDPINFQATTFRGLTKRGVVPVTIDSVYPLPPS